MNRLTSQEHLTKCLDTTYKKIREKIDLHHKKPHNLQLLLVKKTNELLASFNILT